MKTGWNTTDEDEINVRKQRAKNSKFEIVKLHRGKDIFSDYRVNNYKVEIRSLDDYINSCSCPDFATNKLGTCKHIEAVKLQISNQKLTNKKTEIYLNVEDKIVVLYPKRSRKNSIYRKILDPFFGNNNELLFEPVYAFASLKREIEKLEHTKRKKVRVSSQIESWLRRREHELQKEQNKKNFLEDFKNGKRSLNFLKYKLFDYQKEGVLHLAFNERALLADEMGLGKTIQAIGACALLKKLHGIKKVLVISPSSLKTEWEEQIKKFTDLDVIYIKGTKQKRDRIYKEESFFYLANYEQILYDIDEINSILSPDVVILDEAQRIKNWQTKTANSVKKLQSRYAFVLTGTPIENNIDEIYSIVQFLNPYLFGSLFRFNRNFYTLNERGMAVGYKNLHLLHQKLKPIMLRRKKEEVEGNLPPKNVKNYTVEMSEIQKTRYDEYEIIVSRLAAKAQKYPLTDNEFKRLQSSLACMRMLCDTPFILDENIKNSPKIDELMPILEELLKNGKKIIIFSEWERMLKLLKERLQSENIDTAFHAGSVSQEMRKKEIERFKNSKECQIFLSTDSGSVGLNLQVASVVINLDIPWNPAKLEQRIARAWRKHQQNSVDVINLITEESIEHKILYLIKQKQLLSDNVIDGFGDDKQPLPRTQKKFIEDIQKIFEIKKDKKKKKKDIQQIVEDLTARFDDKVSFVAQNKKADTIFVVVDQKDEKTVDSIEKIADKNTQILSKEEFELIRRLDKSGLLSLKGKLKVVLNKEKEKPKDNTKIIKKRLKKIEKNHNLIMMFEKNGFKKESLKMMCKNGMKILNLLILLQEIKKKKITLKTLNIIKKKYAVGDNFDKFFDSLNGRCGKKDKKIIQNGYKKLYKIVKDIKIC